MGTQYYTHNPQRSDWKLNINFCDEDINCIDLRISRPYPQG